MLRKEKGLSQSELSKIFDVAQNTLSQWETGRRDPDTATVARLARFFNVPTDYLLGIDSPPSSDIKQPQELLEILEQEEYTLNGKLATPEGKARLQAIITAIYKQP